MHTLSFPILGWLDAGYKANRKFYYFRSGETASGFSAGNNQRYVVRHIDI